MRENKFIFTDNIAKMTEFVLKKKNTFQFNGKVKHQISSNAIGTKFAPTYVCLFVYGLSRK